MFDEPEIWRPIRNFPGFLVSSEGRVYHQTDDYYVDLKVNRKGEPEANFAYYTFSYNGPVWRLMLMGFYEISMIEFFDIYPDYRDGHPDHLDVFNLVWYKTDGSPLLFRREDGGDWKRVRRHGKAVKVVETGAIYESARALSEALDLRLNSIYICLRGEQKTVHGFHLEYAE